MHGQDVPHPVILIISGPAGSGKTTLCDRLLEEFADRIQRIVTTTTRKPRPGETNGTDYHFLTPGEFEQDIEKGAFIEWARVHGRYYGSRKEHVLKMLTGGKDLLLNIDIQGAQAFRNEPQINEILPDGLHTIFIKPVSMEQIRERLERRGSDSIEEIERRLTTAAREITVADQFDHVIVSGSREEDYQALRELYLSIRK